MNSIDYPKIRTQITNSASNIRGEIINLFCWFESEVMDVLIIGWAFDNEKERELFIKKNPEWKLPMSRKQELLKRGIKRYEEENEEELTGLYGSIDSIMECRHILAHWMADVSNPGIEHYLKTNSIRFITFNPKSILDNKENHYKKEFLYNTDKHEKLRQEIDNVVNQLIKIVKRINS